MIELTPTEQELLEAAAQPGGKRIAPNYPPLVNLLKLGFVTRSSRATATESYYTASAAGLKYLKANGVSTPKKVLT